MSQHPLAGRGLGGAKLSLEPSDRSLASLVRDGENGFVIEPGDIDALAAALLRIFSDPEIASRMGERSLEIVGEWGFREDIDGLKAALRYYFGDRVPDGS